MRADQITTGMRVRCARVAVSLDPVSHRWVYAWEHEGTVVRVEASVPFARPDGSVAAGGVDVWLDGCDTPVRLTARERVQAIP